MMAWQPSAIFRSRTCLPSRPHFRPDLIPSSKSRRITKSSILSVKYYQCFSVCFILLISSSFSAKSDEEPHPRLSSRIALRAPATVTNEQLQHLPTESQLTVRCQGPTCGNSQPTRSTEEKPPPNGREIPHHAKVASYYKSALSLRRRGCMCPVPQDVQPTKENPTHERNESQEKKEMEEKEETAGHSGKKGETGHSEPSRTKNEIAKRPFPNEEKRPKSSHVVVSDPRDDAQPLVPPHHKTLSPPVERAINRSLFYPLTPQLSQPPSRDRSTSASKSSGKDASSRQQWLDAHNSVRRKYSVGAVGWDAGLEASAQAWADRCVFEHSRGEWGENIAAGQPSVDAVVFDWVYGPDECSVYNPRVPIPSHFTQVTWFGTTHIGCAVTRCANVRQTVLSNVFFWVCQYSPAGNVLGQFASNVRATAGQCLR